MISLEPNREQLEIFIQAMFRHCGKDGVVSLRAFYEGEDKSFRITDISLKGGLLFLVEAAEDDARRAANNPKRVVFCPPVAVFAPTGRAREIDLLQAPALSVELDENPRRALDLLERLLGPATLVVRSGGTWTDPATGEIRDKLHAHWRLKEPATGKDNIAKLKRAREIATALAGGDTTNIPACHPIRWPGSWHRKNEPRLCEIISTDNLDHELDLEAALRILDQVAPKKKTNGAAGAQQDNDSNERADWDELVGNVMQGKQNTVHQSLTKLAIKLLAAGMKDAAALRFLRGLMKASMMERNERWQVRYNYIPRAVSSGRATIDAQPQASTTAKAASAAKVFDPWERYIVPAFPLDILPQVARDYVTTQSAVIGACPSALAMSVLGTFSGALNHGFTLKMLRNGTWYERPRLWVLLVADPSQRKTPILKATTRPIVHYETHLRVKYQRALDDYARSKDENGDSPYPEPEPPPRYLAWDTTTEKLGEILARCGDKGVLVITDEVSGWLGAMERYSSNRGAERGWWNCAYDGGPRSVDRIKRGELFIKNLSVSLLACVQPERLAEVQGLTSDGLLQRFLPIMVGSAKFPQDIESKDEAYSKLVRLLIFAKPQRLIMTDDALVAMNDLRQYLFNLEEASEGLAAGFQSFVGKLHGICGALALILHMAHDPEQGAAMLVGEHTVQDVRRLMLDFILPHAKEFYRGAASEGDRLRRLASWVLTSAKDRVLASDLTTNVADFRGLKLAEVNERVSPLIAAGWLTPADFTPTCRSWTVTPLVRTQLAERARIEEARKAALAALMGSPRKKGLSGNST
jgi:hypothetical protein